MYFDLDFTFTHDELKREFRRLSKLYHPDISHDDGKKFREVAAEYELLKSGKLKPPKKVRTLGKMKFYEFFSDSRVEPIRMKVPKEAFRDGATVFLMEKGGGQEIRLHLPANSSFPSQATFDYRSKNFTVLLELDEYYREA